MVAVRRQSPIDGSAHVVELAAIARPIPWPGLPRRAKSLRTKQVAKISGGQPGDIVGFAFLGKLFQRIGPNRLEQPPPSSRWSAIQGQQRFGDQVCNALENGCDLTLRVDGRGGLQRKASREYGRAADHPPLPFGQQLVAPVQRSP